MLRSFSAAAAAAALTMSLAAPALAAAPPDPALAEASVASGAPVREAEPVFRPNVRAALAVGALTMLIPGIIGGFRTAYGASDGDKSAGLLLACGGFTLAPIFSHMVTHEWKRAALFGVIPVISTVAATVLIAENPGAVYHGTMESRTAFGILLGVGMLDAVLGLADTASAGDRARDRLRPDHRSLFVVPAVQREGAMLAIGGTL